MGWGRRGERRAEKGEPPHYTGDQEATAAAAVPAVEALAGSESTQWAHATQKPAVEAVLAGWSSQGKEMRDVGPREREHVC